MNINLKILNLKYTYLPKKFFRTRKRKVSQKDNIVYLHQDESLDTTLYHLIFADLLIGSNSGLSYVAHYLNSGKSIFKRSFRNPNRPFYPNCIETNNLGYIQDLNNLEI